MGTEISKLILQRQLVKNPNCREADQWDVYKRKGVESETKYKTIQWQGGGFQIINPAPYRPTTRPRLLGRATDDGQIS